MKKILILSRFGNLAASSRYRILQYLPYFEEHNIDYKVIEFVPNWLYSLVKYKKKSKLVFLIYNLLIVLSRFLNMIKILSIFKDYDYIFIQKILFPKFFINRIRSKKIIFELDDAIYNFEYVDNKLKQFLNQIVRRNFFYLVKNADLVVTTNRYIEKVLKNINSEIPVLKIVGPIDHNKIKYKDYKDDDKKSINIGWIGTPMNQHYIFQIKDALIRLVNENKDKVINFFLIGSSDDFKIDGLNIINNPWSLEKENDLLLHMDIGIMPLEISKFTKGKGGLKILQYMSVAIPSVATPIGINKEILKDGEIGYFATNQDEWFEKLNLLVNDCELRKELGQNGRKLLERSYSVKSSVNRIVDKMNLI